MSYVQPLLDWLAGLGQLIFCTLQRWICWYMDWFFKLTWAALKVIIPQIPPSAQDAIDSIANYGSMLDAWIPLSDTGTEIFGLWLTSVFLFIIGRWFRQLLPF